MKFFRGLMGSITVLFLIGVSILSLNAPDELSGPDAQEIQKKLSRDVPGEALVLNNSVVKMSTDVDGVPLQDNPDIYQYDDPGSVVTMYVVVRRGNDLENTNHSWAEVNNATKFFFENMEHVLVPQAEVILQIGDENGPLPGELGYGELVTNATIQIRGSGTSMRPQKSYKIEMFDGAGRWREQKTIALNKHISDPTRARNKLSFDLLKAIPNTTSLRTQFVHLYVKDETSDPPAQAYVDYGLFTQVEQPNQRFLRNHYLDRYGQLYKTIMFEFFRYPDQLRAADDPLYDPIAFETVLEIKGNQDHTKLIQMLDDVNNWAIPIEDTFEKYFNAENYFTWMAFNILVGNVDTNAQNFYLYSPQNSQTWYFMPWDYDGAFFRQAEISVEYSPLAIGVSNYWGAVLHQRVLMAPQYREKLHEKVLEVLEILTPERLKSMTDIYRPVTDRYVDQMPDVAYLPATLAQYDQAYSIIPNEPQLNYAYFLESLEKPMPFFLGTPEEIESEGTFRFAWGEAYDFDAEEITYHFLVATDWNFENVVLEATLVDRNQIVAPKLEPGLYFWRVLATNESGQTQVPFDDYIDSTSHRHSGMKYLYVSPEGDILERQREPKN